MIDIVQAAIDRHRLAGNARITWVVNFEGDKQKSGTIEPLGVGSGNYVLDKEGMPFYFSASKVVYLRPSEI